MIWDIIEQTTFDKYFQDLSSLTIQTLLIDENIITEFKNLNPKLIEYLENNKKQFIQKLIGYTVVMPTQNDSEDRIRKLPYVSSEVLSIDNQLIYKTFFQENSQQIDYFMKLMQIFDTKAAENQILLGYFVKIIQNLYKSQKKNTTLKIYQSRNTLYKHLNKQSVGNVFKLFLILLQTEEGFMLQQRKQIIKKLIDSLVKQKQHVKIVAKNILIDVIMKFQTFSSGDELLNCILNSERILEIFSIIDSEAVDDFLIGYLMKAMQKICTQEDYHKQIIVIPENHRNLIKNFFISKRVILIQDDKQENFINQNHLIIKKLNKNIIKLLLLIQLSLENGIINFLLSQDLQNLWKIITRHQFNDIVKVKVFEIFSLIYIKKDENVKNLFQVMYFGKVIQLFKQNKQMFGYFLYQLWKIQLKRSNIFNLIPQNYVQAWKSIKQHFEKYENYEQQIKKIIDKYSNRTKNIKLVVDQQEISVTKTSQNQSNTNNERLIKVTQSQIKNLSEESQPIQTKYQTELKLNNKKQNDSFDFTFNQLNPINSKVRLNLNQKLKSDPFAAFDFVEKQQQSKKEQKNKTKIAEFSNFSDFF